MPIYLKTQLKDLKLSNPDFLEYFELAKNYGGLKKFTKQCILPLKESAIFLNISPKKLNGFIRSKRIQAKNHNGKFFFAMDSLIHFKFDVMNETNELGVVRDFLN
jgi:hypothetical protein